MPAIVFSGDRDGALFPAICQGRSERKEVMKTANLFFLGNQASPNIDFLKAKGTLLSGKCP